MGTLSTLLTIVINATSQVHAARGVCKAPTGDARHYDEAGVLAVQALPLWFGSSEHVNAGSFGRVPVKYCQYSAGTVVGPGAGPPEAGIEA